MSTHTCLKVYEVSEMWYIV